MNHPIYELCKIIGEASNNDGFTTDQSVRLAERLRRAMLTQPSDHLYARIRELEASLLAASNENEKLVGGKTSAEARVKELQEEADRSQSLARVNAENHKRRRERVLRLVEDKATLTERLLHMTNSNGRYVEAYQRLKRKMGLSESQTLISQQEHDSYIDQLAENTKQIAALKEALRVERRALKEIAREVNDSWDMAPVLRGQNKCL